MPVFNRSSGGLRVVPKVKPVKLRRDVTGERFANLVVEGYYGVVISKSGKTESVWICACDCGERYLHRQSDITGKKIKRCGCFN